MAAYPPVIVQDAASCSAEIIRLLQMCQTSTVKGISLDTEYESDAAGRHKVALLSLHHSGYTILIRLKQVLATGGIPQNLKNILTNKDYVKFGVGITDDAKYLLADYGLQVTPILELVTITEDKYEGRSLSSLYSSVMGKILNKGAQTTKWEDVQLSKNQIDYAVADVKAAWEIYNKCK